MSFVLDKYRLDTHAQSLVFDLRLSGRNKWRVKLYHVSGGIKKDWFLGQDNCPIQEISFEKNLKICGAGKIKFAFLDFPVDANDYIILSYDGNVIYRAIVDNSADKKGGEDIKLIPYNDRFKELLYNGTFTNNKLSYIFQTIVESKQIDSGVFWSDAYIDADLLNDADVYSINYDYEYCQKIFDDLIDKVPNLYYGVNEYNFFTIYKMEQSVSKLLFNNSSPLFTKVKTKREYTNFGATRYQVYYKDNVSGDSVRAGQVGYGAGYDVLPVESYLRKKEDKKTYSVTLTDTEAKDFAYSELTNKKVPLSIDVTAIDMNRYVPYIGQMITVQDNLSLALNTVVDCNSTDGWNEVCSLDTTDYVEKDFDNNIGGSITFTSSDNLPAIYTFDRVFRPNYSQKIGFMIKSSISGDFLSFSWGYEIYGACSFNTCSFGAASIGQRDSQSRKYLFQYSYKIPIPNTSTWNYIEFDVSQMPEFKHGTMAGIKNIAFFDNVSTGATINIDRIQLYEYTRQEYTSNIIKINTKINKDGYIVDLTLNSYDLQANKELFKIQKQIQALEVLQQEV